MSSGRTDEYQAILDGYRETWLSTAKNQATASARHPSGTSDTARQTLYEIRRSLTDEIVAAIEGQRPDFARLATSVTYSVMFATAFGGDLTSLSQLQTVMQRACVAAAESSNRSTRSLFDYAIFRLFELARVFGYRLTDEAVAADRRVAAGNALLVMFEGFAQLIHELMEAELFAQVVTVDERWEEALPNWRAVPRNRRGGEDENSPDGLWAKLIDTRALTRFAMAGWVRSHSSESSTTVSDRVLRDFASIDALEGTYLSALASIDDKPRWWQWWLRPETVTEPVMDVATLRSELTRSFLWLELQRIENWPPQFAPLTPLRNELVVELERLQPPARYSAEEGEARRTRLRGALQDLHE